jgi:hypothetical protein
VLSAEEVEAAAVAKDQRTYQRTMADVLIRWRLDQPMPVFPDGGGDEYEWEHRWDGIRRMHQVLRRGSGKVSPAVHAAVAEFDADMEAYWRAHPELDDELAPEPEPWSLNALDGQSEFEPAPIPRTGGIEGSQSLCGVGGGCDAWRVAVGG